MGTKRTILRVTVVLFLALGAGHLVQTMHKNQPGQVAKSGSLGGLQQVVAGAEHRIRPKSGDDARSAVTVIHPPQIQDEPVAAPARPVRSDDQSALTGGTDRFANVALPRPLAAITDPGV
ncbi:hypothetical protein [Gemmobacter sp. 24YEA27]|uniref:hypothetical protein n=1 Tax=Gemmobacter sp. 24YEA27 TaxID=3040672 RepID=UPI0024B32A30|nr:hypothetical protein [Gemmobacter sp. 24YEA27]